MRGRKLGESQGFEMERWGREWVLRGREMGERGCCDGEMVERECVKKDKDG